MGRTRIRKVRQAIAVLHTITVTALPLAATRLATIPQTLSQVIVDEGRNVGTEMPLVDHGIRIRDLKLLQLYRALLDLSLFL